ncbi:uncharacterized protein [Macaca fascicularis]|uniref:uncharacterized protein n=1 Tax=Macaca fascicularis TaxID=9541 RepID=UPI003D15B297
MGPCRWETDFPLSCSPSAGPKEGRRASSSHSLRGEVGTSVFPTPLADAPAASTPDARASGQRQPRAPEAFTRPDPRRGSPTTKLRRRRRRLRPPPDPPLGLRTELAPLKAEARVPLLDGSCPSAGAAGGHVGGPVGGHAGSRGWSRGWPVRCSATPSRAAQALTGASGPSMRSRRRGCPQRGGAGGLPVTPSPRVSHPRPPPTSLAPRPPPPSLGARDRLGTLGPGPSTEQPAPVLRKPRETRGIRMRSAGNGRRPHPRARRTPQCRLERTRCRPTVRAAGPAACRGDGWRHGSEERIERTLSPFPGG